ncbi:N-acylglucosamine 2-epimerase [Yeosuana aromativorans]|uniref:N-acylglucosamine 2-epimerase n=2 Tax=Yeosuana aromativorans TaxID=288019 RepID=A0A8J3BNG5_9FLAO|nr:N-acylglucosamine 2-epimerase [Yeosuana aromativorans]
MKKYIKLYRDALLKDVIPFWEKYSIDYNSGGYFSCLDRFGNVYDEDKFMWPQARQAWVFSMLYNKVKKKREWLKIAKNGIDFIKNHGMTNDGDFYFSVAKNGVPLIQPYNIFSDCFAAMAFSQYAVASGDESVKQLAVQTYFNILKKQNNPKGAYEKSTGNRSLKSFALPMILSNLVLELEQFLDKDEVEKMIDTSINDIMTIFLDKESGLIYEFVKPDGSLENSFNGRLINPGHGIEAMWFMIDIGVRRNDIDLINKATSTIIRILEYSWDDKYDGIFYFMDAKGKPPQQLEWDQKLWWVHLESLVALSKAYLHTNRKDVWDWFEKVHDYSWKHFSDPKNGEWFGYLNRQGEVLLDMKGGKWKGCFHVPRAMYQCWKTFENI